MRELLAAGASDGRTPSDHAAHVCDQLTTHISRLVGEIGVRTLFRRSLVLASAPHPWLAASVADLVTTEATRACCESLRPALQTQDPELAMEGFIAVMSAFVGLLARLIGERLVRSLLHEVWPASVPHAREETT